MKRPATLTLTLALLTLVALCVAASTDGDGKAIFLAQKCNTCHAVSSAGIEAKTTSAKMKGPDLTGVGERYEREWIVKYVQKEVDKDGKSHSTAFKGSDEELEALVDWLLEQK